MVLININSPLFEFSVPLLFVNSSNSFLLIFPQLKQLVQLLSHLASQEESIFPNTQNFSFRTLAGT